MTLINYKLGELFCGPGGIALGAKNAQIQCVTPNIVTIDSFFEPTH
jgi:site-specific DNA-cytosine methylase